MQCADAEFHDAEVERREEPKVDSGEATWTAVPCIQLSVSPRSQSRALAIRPRVAFFLMIRPSSYRRFNSGVATSGR